MEKPRQRRLDLLFGGMTMEGKYVEGMGNVRISEEVISTIVAVAALEVKGVVALMPRPASDIKGLLPGKKTPSKNVRVDEQNGQVVIEQAAGGFPEPADRGQEGRRVHDGADGVRRQRLCAGRQAARAKGGGRGPAGAGRRARGGRAGP